MYPLSTIYELGSRRDDNGICRVKLQIETLPAHQNALGSTYPTLSGGEHYQHAILLIGRSRSTAARLDISDMKVGAHIGSSASGSRTATTVSTGWACPKTTPTLAPCGCLSKGRPPDHAVATVGEITRRSFGPVPTPVSAPVLWLRIPNGAM